MAYIKEGENLNTPIGYGNTSEEADKLWEEFLKIENNSLNLGEMEFDYISNEREKNVFGKSIQEMLDELED